MNEEPIIKIIAKNPKGMYLFHGLKFWAFLSKKAQLYKGPIIFIKIAPDNVDEIKVTEFNAVRSSGGTFVFKT